MGTPHARPRRRLSYSPLLLFIATFVLCGLPPLLGLIGLIWLPPSSTPSQPLPTAIIQRLTAPPIAPPPVAAATPTSVPTATATPLVWHIGQRVVVFGTGGTGLNLRQSPTLTADSAYLAHEGELFVLLRGPIESGGFRWWWLQKADDPSIIGWAVERYLQVAP